MEYVSEIHRLLKLGDAEPVHLHGLPEGLPMAYPHAEPQTHAVALPADPHFEIVAEKPSRLKALLVYPAIFIGAFLFFYVILNFPSMVAQVQGWFTKPQQQVQLGDQLTAYYNWIEGYYFAVSDPKLLDPNADIDKDGLTNMDEFIMHTNPILADSDADGYSDGVEVLNGYNPWGPGAMTDAQKTLAQGIDQFVISNRISYDSYQSSNPNGVVAAAVVNNYNQSKPGVLSIPRLNLQVPLIWSQDPSDFEADLSNGVIHYPGTAMPGEAGIIYVSGHSSDYIWKKDPYAQVFTKINVLKPGDDIFVQVYGQDGKTYNYRYQVTGSHIYKPDDQTQFVNDSAHILNLSTCWPIGTQTNRLVVSAVQVSL